MTCPYSVDLTTGSQSGVRCAILSGFCVIWFLRVLSADVLGRGPSLEPSQAETGGAKAELSSPILHVFLSIKIIIYPSNCLRNLTCMKQ